MSKAFRVCRGGSGGTACTSRGGYLGVIGGVAVAAAWTCTWRGGGRGICTPGKCRAAFRQACGGMPPASGGEETGGAWSASRAANTAKRWSSVAGVANWRARRVAARVASIAALTAALSASRQSAVFGRLPRPCSHNLPGPSSHNSLPRSLHRFSLPGCPS